MMFLLLLSMACSVASTQAAELTRPLVMCSGEQLSIIRVEPQLESNSIGTIAASTCNIVVTNMVSATTGMWLYVQQKDDVSGWVFVSNKWNFDLRYPEMMTLYQTQEVKSSFLGMYTSEIAYTAAFDRYLTMPTCPAVSPKKEPITWTGDCTTQWSDIGWKPREPIYCQYTIFAVNTKPPMLTMFAACDMDGDKIPAIYSQEFPGGTLKVLTPSTIR